MAPTPRRDLAPAPASPPQDDPIMLASAASSGPWHLRIVGAFGVVLVLARLAGVRVPLLCFAIVLLLGVTSWLAPRVPRLVPDRRRAYWVYTALFSGDAIATIAGVWLFGAERWFGAAGAMLSVIIATAALRGRGGLVVTLVTCASWLAVFALEWLGWIPVQWLFAGTAPGLGDPAFTAVAAAGGVLAIVGVSVQLVGVVEMFHTNNERLRAAEERLRQAQKMEAVGQLAGGVAHDFNNLLTAINTNLELALDALPPGHDVREDIAEARRASARAAELTRQLLAFGKPHQAAPRMVALNDVLAGAERLLRRAVAEVELTLALGPEAGAVLADPGQLEQVAMNLVVNARDAVDGVPGGHVIVETGALHGARGAEGVAAWTTLTVRDNGVGMDAATQQRIFEPFYTTKPVGHGSGLGLASVYAIVERAGGEVAVESVPGRGTTMTVRLPRVGDGATASGSFAAAAAPPARPRPVTILLVEDETPVRTSLRRMLERQGHTVIEARHGGDALLQWQHHAGQVDLLLTDVLMPGMGGPELAELLQAMRPALPVLFMSGYTGDAEQTRGIPEEALLVKPFTSEALASQVARLVG